MRPLKQGSQASNAISLISPCDATRIFSTACHTGCHFHK